MAKLIAPLLSFDASGHIGQELTFSTWKKIQVVKRFSQPGTAATADQIAERAYFALLQLRLKEPFISARGLAGWDLRNQQLQLQATGRNTFFQKIRTLYEQDPTHSIIYDVYKSSGSIWTIKARRLSDGAPGTETGNFNWQVATNGRHFSGIGSYPIRPQSTASQAWWTAGAKCYMRFLKDGLERSGWFDVSY